MLDTCYAAVVELVTMATNFGGVSGGDQNVSEVQSLRQRKLFSNQLFADANFEVFCWCFLCPSYRTYKSPEA